MEFNTFDNIEMYEVALYNIEKNEMIHKIIGEQKRKHKNKRINKKWLKKYGRFPIKCTLKHET